MGMARDTFGRMPDGTVVDRFTLSNAAGVTCRIITYGAILTSVRMPDRAGRVDEITLGHDSLEEYLAERRYFGAVIGRYANRIAGGRFSLQGVEYTLARNDGGLNHLHGGVQGFDRKLWRVERVGETAAAGLTLSCVSPDGEEGYPGRLEARVTYALSDDNELSIEYRARADRPTPVNLTHHAYWNLAGCGSGAVLGHELTLYCPRYLEVDSTLIPTGEIRPVGNTPMDFLRPKRIGADIDRVPGGYDHCFVIQPAPERLRPAARVIDPSSGRGLELLATQPGLQFYSGNFLEEDLTVRGRRIGRRGAFCLETQDFPDAVNRPQFPSPVLRPGDEYHHRAVHRFFIG